MGDKVKLVIDEKNRRWSQCNESIHNQEEISTQILCECGNLFWIDSPDIVYHCRCGKLYKAHVTVEVCIVDSEHIIAVCKECKKLLLYHTVSRDIRAGCLFRKEK